MGDEVETSECFAGARHASHKANRLPALGLSLFDNLLKADRGFAEVFVAGF
jgi:hypothetical protein